MPKWWFCPPTTLHLKCPIYPQAVFWVLAQCHHLQTVSPDATKATEGLLGKSHMDQFACLMSCSVFSIVITCKFEYLPDS